jgi:hypothetical protein
VLALPEDMLTDPAEVPDAPPYTPLPIAPDDGTLRQFHALLSEAKKPFVIVGGGGWSDQARGDLEACGRPVRRVWANGKGNFRVTGRYASASKGRWWLTTDYCDRTVLQPRTGSLLVRDLVTKKRVVVKAPNTYVARRKR